MEDKVVQRKTFTFGAWNVRGLTEKKRETFAEIEREGKDLVVLTETKLRGSGKEECSNYVHVYSGVRVGVARAGVSMLIKKEHAYNMRWKVINERIIKVRLKIFNQKVVVLGVYWVDDNSKPDVKDRFEDALSRVIKHVKFADELIILGDMNAWVGTSNSSRIIGKFGENKLNNNGRRLLEMCDMYRLKIQNSFFDHEDVHKYTFNDCRSQTRSIIDYFITRQGTSLKIIDVIACRWLECGTDHVYLEAIAVFPFAPAVTSDSLRYNSYLLFSETIELQYKKHLDENIILAKDRSVNDLYQHFKDVIHSAAREVLGVATQEERSQFLWDEELCNINSSRRLKCGRKPNNTSLDHNANYPEIEIKNEVWKGICKTIDNIPNQYQKSNVIWAVLNEFKNKTDTTLTKDKELIEICFKNCFKESRPEFANVKEDAVGKSVFSIFPADVIQALDEFEDSDVLSPGGISMRLLKHSGIKLKKLLRDLIQAIFDGQKIPDEINETFFIYRPGDEKLLNHLNNSKCVPHAVMQVMGAIVKNFIEKWNSFKEKCKIIHEESRLNATFILRLLIQKCTEKQNKPLHLVFINLEETFMDVPRTKLFLELHKLGVEDNLFEIIKHLYSDNTVRIIFPDETSQKSYPITKGLKKECLLSSTLFQIYVRKAVKDWLKENDKKGFSLDNLKLFSLMSQHTNLVIISDNRKHLGAAVEGLLKHFEKINLQIGFRCIKYLGVFDEQERELKVGRKCIASEDSFEFIGSVLEVGGRNETDICNRIINAKNAIGVLHSVARDKQISKENKKGIYRAIIENCLTFGCETWTMTEKFMGRLHTVEMAYWRWCCENYPHRYSRERICELMDVEESIEDTVKLKRSAWYAKVKLMSQNKWPKVVLEWDADGKSKPGRRKRWVEGIEEFINELSLRENFVTKNRHLENMIEQNRDSQGASSK